MATDEQPNFDGLKKVLGEFGKAMEQAGHVFAAQGAFGWMFRGDLEQARKTLEGLPADKLQEVSMAAAALASLADEVAMEKKP